MCSMFKLTPLNFTFSLKLFIDHLEVFDEFKTDDIDLDLQGQESSNVCLIPCECDNF